LNAEAQEARFKENTNWKNRGKKRKKMLLAGFSTAVAGLALHRWKWSTFSPALTTSYPF
jgi:hypothetical protein